jgi:hypothetical protein
MKIAFGEISLAGGVSYGETPIDFKIFGQRSMQLIETIRAAEAKAIDRGNLSTRIEFRVRKKHDTTEDAQIYALSHASELHDLETTLTITAEPSNRIYLLPHAVMERVESDSNGNVSEHFYRIVGGTVRTVLEEE